MYISFKKVDRSKKEGKNEVREEEARLDISKAKWGLSRELEAQGQLSRTHTVSCLLIFGDCLGPSSLL